MRERQELPGLPWKLSSQIVQVARNDGRIAGQAIGGSAWAIELGEHSPDLGSRSASRRVAIASSSRARRVVFVCVLDGEPTCPAGWSCRGPAHLVDVVPNPWKSVLSAVDVESGAAKPHHASKQTELGRGGGCGPAAVPFGGAPASVTSKKEPEHMASHTSSSPLPPPLCLGCSRWRDGERGQVRSSDAAMPCTSSKPSDT